MPLIDVHTTNFPAASGVPNGQFVHTCEWSDIVWAAITVGKRELFDLVRFGQYSFFEIVFRSATIYANLKERPDGHIERSQVYDGLDPSEKAATSYFLGLMAAKLLADAYVQVPWLMHLDVYRHNVNAVLTGRSRPDLIGQDAMNRWVVFESKGRTGDRDSNAMALAKQQALQIATISGHVPHLYSAVQAHFTGDVLCLDWDDPPRDERARVDISVSPEELREAYYRPFERMLRERDELPAEVDIGGQQFRAVELPDADLIVGVDPVAMTIQQFALGRREPIRRREQRLTVGSDGIMVQLGQSWSEINMRMEPQTRSRLLQG